MTGIADFGGGNYYYVRESRQLAGIFQRELKERRRPSRKTSRWRLRNTDVMLRVQEIRIAGGIKKAMRLFELGRDKEAETLLDRTARTTSRNKDARPAPKLEMLKSVTKRMRRIKRANKPHSDFLKDARHGAYKLSK